MSNVDGNCATYENAGSKQHARVFWPMGESDDRFNRWSHGDVPEHGPNDINFTSRLYFRFPSSLIHNKRQYRQRVPHVRDHNGHNYASNCKTFLFVLSYVRVQSLGYRHVPYAAVTYLEAPL